MDMGAKVAQKRAASLEGVVKRPQETFNFFLRCVRQKGRNAGKFLQVQGFV
jgi:hypothetical protein